MPLEGLSPSGPLIPNNQKTEALALGAFDSRVEHSAAIKKAADDKESEEENINDEYEGGDSTSGRYTEDGSGRDTSLAPVEEDRHAIKYMLNFNRYTELVELVDIKTGNVIHKIAPHDLIELISELKYTSGIFVDNEV